MFFNRKVIKK